MMDFQVIDTFVKVGGGLSACAALFLGCLLLYKLYANERTDRREAWAAVNKLTEKHNDTLLKNIEAITGITTIIKELKDVINK